MGETLAWQPRQTILERYLSEMYLRRDIFSYSNAPQDFQGGGAYLGKSGLGGPLAKARQFLSVQKFPILIVFFILMKRGGGLAGYRPVDRCYKLLRTAYELNTSSRQEFRCHVHVHECTACAPF